MPCTHIHIYTSICTKKGKQNYLAVVAQLKLLTDHLLGCKGVCIYVYPYSCMYLCWSVLYKYAYILYYILGSLFYPAC